MIYIKTANGWFSTGETDIAQTRLSWCRFALRFYDTNINDYTSPMGYYYARGFGRLAPNIKLRMWTAPESFKLFDEHKHTIKG